MSQVKYTLTNSFVFVYNESMLNRDQFRFRYQLNEGVHNLEAMQQKRVTTPFGVVKGGYWNKGWMQWKDSTGEIDHILVNWDSRRKGIATMLWNRAHELAAERGITAPRHSARRSREGNAWAKSVGGDLPRKKPGEYGPGRIESTPVDPDKYETID